MSDDDLTKPPTAEQLPPNAAAAKAQREREDMLAYLQWSEDGGNNLD